MRRIQQQISQAECVEILQQATSGVLAVSGDDGYPYAVPVSYAYLPGDGLGKIVFHGAKNGHKIDAIRKNNQVSFCIIDQDEVQAEKLSTSYRSVIAFGRARILENEEEIRTAALAVGAKYSPDYESQYRKETEKTIRNGTLCCVEISIEHLTGKIGRQLLLERQKKS